MDIGSRIRQVRFDKQLKAEDIANKANISLVTFYRYEKGDVDKMSVKYLLDIAAALEVSPSYLLGLEDNNTIISGDNNILNGMSGSIGGNVTIGDGGQTKEQAVEGLANQATDALVQEKMLELLTDIAETVKGIEEKL